MPIHVNRRERKKTHVYGCRFAKISWKNAGIFLWRLCLKGKTEYEIRKKSKVK